MATKASTGWIASFVVLIPLLVVAWFLAPLFLPVWRWQNLDFQQLAIETKQPETKLATKFKAIVRYAQRGDEDPMPWQIYTLNPTWASLDPKHEDEVDLLVRVSLLSDRTGEAPSGLLVGLGNTRRDRWFKCEGWRLPPGTFGLNNKRPVFVADMATWDKLSVTQSDVNEGRVTERKVENDDKWEERDDGWIPPPRQISE